ncbi:MAG: hypothetical protein HWN68_14575 [Desulfobacterales bacterium]|nr:hypothetical protein [Desulfobacterales bacterium]
MFEGQGGGEGPNLKDLIDQVLSDREQRKEDRKKINGMAQDMKLVKGMLCDSQGNCRLPTQEDLIRLTDRGKISPEGTIRKDNHNQMYELLRACPDCKEGMQRDTREEMAKDPESMKRAADDPQFRKAFLASVCSDEKCREAFNRDIDEVKSQGKAGEKAFFLDKK